MGTADIAHFGTAGTGEAVDRITLRNDELTVRVLTWGAILQDVRLVGVDSNQTLGSEVLADYEGDLCHHGSLIGPIVNRISTARITIEGMTYELERNQAGRIHLHSGSQATHRRLWQVVEASERHVTLQITLLDGECGLPGNRVITATYRLDGPTLDLTIDATTDTTTCMNMANHSYWNFDGTDTWAGHRLWVAADRYLPANIDDYPIGEIAETKGTVMDFGVPRAIAPQDPPFDNNFCLSDQPQPIRKALELVGESGVGMSVATDQPGIQVYDARAASRPGRGPYEGLAIEAQGWPDAPNNRHFPSITITPDRPYRQQTRFTFLNEATI